MWQQHVSTVSAAPLRWIFKNTALQRKKKKTTTNIVQELCESRGGRTGLSVLTSLLVSEDVKIY